MDPTSTKHFACVNSTFYKQFDDDMHTIRVNQVYQYIFGENSVSLFVKKQPGNIPSINLIILIHQKLHGFHLETIKRTAILILEKHFGVLIQKNCQIDHAFPHHTSGNIK